ncbi:molybdopterin-synthase adenylyltransferase MoeB [Aliikangiella sp. G2MR2-5]|uniref:HesA/MoeB/ThiF family protein n=1 Tax=Aliikangiella sp. G2MR2-5 TaxID=2788943 RepID=UPI0018A9225F|nr:molybdopterin-synthase adenylyltransferase MoeB [Aliikangiella sp. G2MR2-5]
MLTDEQLLKYSRQIMLPQIDIAGQEALLNSHLLIIGLGGLGAPVAMYLAAAGVGELTLIDDDKVDLSNLQRQIIHQFESIGKDKVESAKITALSLNPETRINIINYRPGEEEMSTLIEQANVVIDCCDNFSTRFMLNRICHNYRVPLVSGAAIRWEGQLSTYTYEQGTPCYRCLYEEDAFNDQTCTQNGVVAPLVGVIGSMQAMEAIKLISGTGHTVTGRLMLFDGMDMSWREIRFKPRPACPVCS